MSQIPTGADMGSNTGNAFDRLRAAGRTVWLAGVGAVAEVSEGGLEMFDRLVERGRPFEERQKRRVQAVTDRVNQRVSQKMGEARKLVQDTVEYEGRGVLKRMNVMSREDVKLLGSRIQTLSKKVDEYVARRQTATVEIVEIVSPEGEAVAIVTPEIPTAAIKTKASRPRQKKATR